MRWLIFVFAVFISVTARSETQLDSFDREYQARLETVREPLVSLNETYLKALQAEKTNLQNSGDLDGVIAVEGEISRLSKSPVPVSKIGKNSTLAALQEIHIEQWEALSESLSPEFERLRVAQEARLKTLESDLTRSGDVDAALAVRARLKRLQESAPAEAVTLDTGLVLHLRFEEEADNRILDQSPLENHARFIGDAKTRNTSGTRERFLSLDGDGDFLEIGHHESLVLQEPMSISVWVRPKKIENLRGIVSKYAPHHSWTLRNWKDAERPRISFGDNAEGHRTEGILREGSWTHIVLTLDSGTVRFYLDGELDTEAERKRPLQESTDPVRIGSDYDGRYLEGDIDDVRIYRRSLSPMEVSQLFDSES